MVYGFPDARLIGDRLVEFVLLNGLLVPRRSFEAQESDHPGSVIRVTVYQPWLFFHGASVRPLTPCHSQQDNAEGIQLDSIKGYPSW